jgi:hypothetical protein
MEECECRTTATAPGSLGVPLNPDTEADPESFHGTWIVTSGRDDYGHLKGNGTSKVTLGPPRIESYTGTLINDG